MFVGLPNLLYVNFYKEKHSMLQKTAVFYILYRLLYLLFAMYIVHDQRVGVVQYNSRVYKSISESTFVTYILSVVVICLDNELSASTCNIK